MVKRRRVLLWLFLIAGVANLVRAALAPQVAPVLAEWSLASPLAWLSLFYLCWGLIFAGATIGVWGAARKNRNCRWALPLALGYQLTLWALALSTYRSAYARSLWGRDAMLTGIFLVGVAFLARSKN